MAKPTKYAPHICITFSILAAIGILVGLIFKLPLVIVIALLPTAIYEVYRTEGKSTKASSAILLVVLIAVAILIIFNIDFNLAEYLNSDEEYIGGYLVPLGSIRILGPTIMAVLAIILFIRTYGIYTKWLAVIIFVSAFALVYSLDPTAFSDLLKRSVEEGLDNIN